jgi:hypothetical protein
LLVVLLLVASQISLSPIAYAVRMQQTWMSGVFDDATSADTPAIAVETVALPCVSTELPCPSPIIGSVPSTPETGRSGAPSSASRTRAPPLA